MNKAIKELAHKLDSFIDESAELLPFSSQNLTGKTIQNENFRQLSLFSKISKLMAIDGGNNNLLIASGISVDYIRTACVSYDRKKKIMQKADGFFLLTRSVIKDGKQYYESEAIDLQKRYLIASEGTFNNKTYSIEIEQVPAIVRRLEELNLAITIIENISGDSLLIIDGSAEYKMQEELELLRKLNESASNKHVGFLAKSSRLLTANGKSLSSTLNQLGPKSSWCYYPVYEETNIYPARVYFTKLNSNSNHIFKVEILSKCNPMEDADFILAISKNSDDPILPGYPYCLIEADKIARISNKEKEYLKNCLSANIKNKEKLKYLAADMDSHSILDRISF